MQLIDTPSNKSQIFRWDTKKSKVGVIYNIFLILIVVFTSFTGLRYMIQTNFLGEFTDEKSIAVTIEVLGALCTILILITFCVKQGEMTSILNKVGDVAELSTIMRANSCLRNNSEITKRVVICVINVSLILGILTLTITLYVQNTLFISYAIGHYLHLFINTTMFFQYSIILECIRNLFRFINDEFRELSKPPDFGLYKVWKNEVKEPMKIDKLIRMYNLLSEITERLSDFYSLVVMWCIFNNFLSLFFYLYCNIKRLIALKTEIVRGIFFHLVKIYLNAIQLPILAISVSNTIKEVIQTKFFNCKL